MFLPAAAATGRHRFAWAHVLAAASLLLLAGGWAGLGSTRDRDGSGNGDHAAAQQDVAEQHYLVNARVRPLLFWIGRDRVGGGRISWRANDTGDRAVEFLVGSDPARAPRQINRWGYIKEETTAGTTRVLGVVKESSEETLEEAEARVERERVGGSTFRAMRAIIRDGRAAGGTMTIPTARNLTYLDLDALLALIPPEPPAPRSMDLPPGTEHGFLIATTALIGRSFASCESNRAVGAWAVPTVSYVYKQAIYDLSLRTCEYVSELRTKAGAFANVIKGDFETKNRVTRHVTRFHVAYGVSGEWRGRPVRIVFRPRWWIEFEMLADPGPPPGLTGRKP